MSLMCLRKRNKDVMAEAQWKRGVWCKLKLDQQGPNHMGSLWAVVRTLEFWSKCSGKPLVAFLTGNSWNFDVLDLRLRSIYLEPSFVIHQEEPRAFLMIFTVLVTGRHSCQVVKKGNKSLRAPSLSSTFSGISMVAFGGFYLFIFVLIFDNYSKGWMLNPKKWVMIVQPQAVLGENLWDLCRSLE